MISLDEQFPSLIQKVIKQSFILFDNLHPIYNVVYVSIWQFILLQESTIFENNRS